MSATYAQPFVACDFEGGWTGTVNTQTTYDWVANQWSVPLLASVSKLVRMVASPSASPLASGTGRHLRIAARMGRVAASALVLSFREASKP